MARATRAALACASLLLALGARGAGAAEQHGTWSENPRWGYKVRAPKEWKRRAVPLDEPWIADKFFPDHVLRATGDQNQVVEHRPDLWVIGFPHERTKDGGVTRERLGESGWLLTVTNPYRSYLDFVKREEWAAPGSGGWYVSREEETEQDGRKVSIVEIKVEKLVEAPLRILTWVHHGADCDYAVQVRVLEAHVKENLPVLEGALRSFREIPRTEPFPDAKGAGPAAVPGAEAPRRTVAEIDAERIVRVEERIRREVEHLPKGWSVQTSGNFTVLTQHDKRTTGYVIHFAEELRDYLDEHFSSLGAARVPRGLIRVFASSEEERAYTEGTRGWWTEEVDEIVMTIERGGGILSEFSWLAGRLTDQYFHVKNENLRWGMPGWIRHGIWGHIAWARPSKRQKMVLEPTPSNRRDVALLIQQGTAMPLKALMTTSTDDYASYEHMSQACSVVHWLLHRGDRGKVKGAVLRYLASLDSIIAEEDRAFEERELERWRRESEHRASEEAARAALTPEEQEAEEERQYRERRQNKGQHNEALKAKYDAIRQRAFEAAFGQLTDADWEALDKAWRAYASA